MVEQPPCKRQVTGSIPVSGTTPRMAKLVNAPDLKSDGETHAGSSPVPGTNHEWGWSAVKYDMLDFILSYSKVDTVSIFTRWVGVANRADH